jgi:hypothetical protein
MMGYAPAAEAAEMALRPADARREADLKREADARHMSALWQALGMLSALHPTLEMDADDPEGMARVIVAHVEAQRDEARRFLTQAYALASSAEGQAAALKKELADKAAQEAAALSFPSHGTLDVEVLKIPDPGVVWLKFYKRTSTGHEIREERRLRLGERFRFAGDYK